MTHGYPLHVRVDADCYCCRLVQTFTFSSPSDQVVCAHCVHHLGDAKAVKRDLEHVQLWHDRLAALQESFAGLASTAATGSAEAARTIADLRAKITQLAGVVDGRFAEAPGSEVRTMLETQVTKRAERAAELSNRRTDRVMAALRQLDELHHDDATSPLRCSCGRRIIDCAEWHIVEPQRQAVREWASR